MPRIILIETSTELCSTALVEGEEITSVRESTVPRAHASKTAVFISEMLDERGLKVLDCDAVCLSSGPGSYTGLRVGSSSAKGLCFGAGIPLISICTLDVLVWQAISDGLVPDGCTTVVPMIDARRLEVYCSCYNPVCGCSLPSDRKIRANGPQAANSHKPEATASNQQNIYRPDIRRMNEIRPMVVDENSFAEELAAGPVLFIGDGAEKCREIIKSPNATFIQTCPKAESMLLPSLAAWNEKRFENMAYFEPFYLKDFVATVSRKKLF